MKAKSCWRSVSWLISAGCDNCRTTNSFLFKEMYFCFYPPPQENPRWSQLYLQIKVTYNRRNGHDFGDDYYSRSVRSEQTGSYKTNEFFPVLSLMSLLIEPGCSKRRAYRANSAYKAVPKLRWPPKVRNAVKHYWGTPGEQVSVELAFSGGSEAQNTPKLIACSQTHLYHASHRAPSHPTPGVLHRED